MGVNDLKESFRPTAASFTSRNFTHYCIYAELEPLQSCELAKTACITSSEQREWNTAPTIAV